MSYPSDDFGWEVVVFLEIGQKAILDMRMQALSRMFAMSAFMLLMRIIEGEEGVIGETLQN